MALPSGTKLGSYEILAAIGAGGMGEVYRARDASLGRDVAIKILPTAFSQDTDRLRRFKQEAQAAASLNHPNILAIYYVGDSDATPYIVSEFLEGETLRERIQGGPLSVRKAIEIAVQVARGLAAAHDKGIVHRDLKPENIFVCRDGRVKILDFGLAKLTRPEESESSSDALTLTAGSEPGFVLGTAGYMSPEQVRGQLANPTSDLFSFGAILYEMLTGNRAFRGGSAADTMSAILKEDPPELTATSRQVPPALDRIVRHCLEKTPEQRFQSARDVAFDLESLSSASGIAPAATRSTISRRSKWLIYGAAAALGMVAAFVAGSLMGSGKGEATRPSYHRLTFRQGTIQAARFTADGQSLIYSADFEADPAQIFATRPESPESRAISVSDSFLLSVSPKGELAALLHPRMLQVAIAAGTLAREPLEGGAPREILAGVESADWSPDGARLLITRFEGGEDHLEFPMGKLIYKTAGIVGHPRFSPRGDRIAFFDYGDRINDSGSVAVIDLAGNKLILSKDWTDLTGLAWSANGDEIWFTGDRNNSTAELYAVNLSGRERVVSGSAGDLILYDIARDGRILLGREDWQSRIYGLPPGETRERDLSDFDFSIATDLSRDGKTLLLVENGESSGASGASYLRKTDGSPAVRLFDGPCSALSQDGSSVICSTPDGQLVQVPTKSGETKTLTHDSIYHGWAQWLPGETSIFFLGQEGGRGMRGYVQSLGGQPRAITPEGATFYARISPDGKWLAIALGADDQTLIFPIAGGDPRSIPGLQPGEIPVGWTPDGRSLYLSRDGDRSLNIVRVDVATGHRTPWKRLSPPDPVAVTYWGSICMGLDGKSYMYTVQRRFDVLYIAQGLH